MNSVSPRSLQLLHDIVSEGENDNFDLETDTQTDASRRVETMNEEKDVKDTLNFFEKLEQETRPIENGYDGGHVENGVEAEDLNQIEEESEQDSYTVTEISETTEETSNYDNNRLFSKKQSTVKLRKQRPSKASSVRENSTDRDSVTETMSDSGQVGRRQRKLNKRAQMRAFRCLGVEPLETAEVKLERKYQELEDLMSTQFSEQKRALGINHLQQMELLRQQYEIASHGLPPTGILVPRSMPSQYRGNRGMTGDKENLRHPASEDEAYTTIRTLQATKPTQRRSRARSARTRPLSATRNNQSRSTSRDRVDRDSNKEQNYPEGNKESRHATKSRSRSTSKTRSRSSSGSPRRMYIQTETHLKNTDNELVKEWIKKKDVEYRRKKAEERKKRKLDRQKKIEEQIEREEKFQDSAKIVQQWMKQKKKEVYRKQRQDRVEMKEETARKAQRRAKRLGGIHGWGVDNPQPLSAPTPIQSDRNKIRVSRPGTTVAEVQALKEQRSRECTVTEIEFNYPEVPQPPVTKYVYKRPVLGKVRLRLKEPEAEHLPPATPKKVKERPRSKEEIEKKQRVSYDDWLVKKRKEDAEQRKETQRQEEIALSQERERTPVPDLVQNGENNVLRGKGIPGTGSRDQSPYVSRIISEEERERIRGMALEKKAKLSLEEELEASYDIEFESEEEALERVAKNLVRYVIKSLSNQEDEEDVFEDDDEAEHEGLASLKIQGSRSTLSSKSRPMSASAAYIPGPQASRSPRRPVSAQPKPKLASREAVQGALPFPPDIGAPPHVQQLQKKMFSDKMWVNPEEGERPEPQGSDINESENTEVEDFRQREENGLNTQPTNDSVTGSKKRVSFCDQTTIFDDKKFTEESYEEIEEDWEEVEDDYCVDRRAIIEELAQASESQSIE